MKGKEKEKMSTRKEKQELSKKRKHMFEQCIKQASNGQLGESSNKDLDGIEGNIEKENFEFLCRVSSNWL